MEEFTQFTARRYTTLAALDTEFMLLAPEPGDESVIRVLVLTVGAPPLVFSALRGEVATDEGFATVCLDWLVEQGGGDQEDGFQYAS